MSKGLVILVRGIPGCGKSTHVEALRKKYEKDTGDGPDFVVCSADKFFIRTVPCFQGVDGSDHDGEREVYQFDPTKLAQAHVYCMSEFLDAIHAGTKVIVVDNTFIRMWEMKNYVKMANYLDYDVDYHEIRVKTIEQLKVCAARNIHKVPAEVIAKMAMEFEPMNEEWRNVRVIPFLSDKIFRV